MSELPRPRARVFELRRHPGGSRPNARIAPACLAPRPAPRLGLLLVASTILSLAAATAGPAAAAKGGRPASLLGQRPQEKTLISHGRSTLAHAAALGRNQSRSPSPKLPRLRVPFKGPKTGAKPSSTGKLMAPATSSSGVHPLISSAAPPAVPKSFDGLSNADNNPAVEPPDPWVAVNGTYVIQAVNSLVRVSTRAGATLETLPTWALFSLPNGQFGTDGRIIWDAFHGRWVGVLTSFDGTLTTNYLNLVVSETADPLGAWKASRSRSAPTCLIFRASLRRPTGSSLPSTTSYSRQPRSRARMSW